MTFDQIASFPDSDHLSGMLKRNPASSMDGLDELFTFSGAAERPPLAEKKSSFKERSFTNCEPSLCPYFIGLFDQKNFRSICLLKDLVTLCGPIRGLILFDQETSPASLPEGIQVIEKQRLFLWLSAEWGIDASILSFETEAFKFLLKIFLCYYARKVLFIDYAIMLDNDIFIFEPIPEILSLAKQKIPFFINQYASSTSESFYAVENLVDQLFKLKAHPSDQKKIKLANVGFCGLKLNIFDLFQKEIVHLFLKYFHDLPFWEKEQLLIVYLTFCKNPSVQFLGKNQRYYFAMGEFRKNKGLLSDFSNRFKHLNAPAKSIKRKLQYVLWFLTRSFYQKNSKIYHCIGTANKKPVDMLYAKRHSVLNARRYQIILKYIQTNDCKNILEIGVWRGDTSEQILLNTKSSQSFYYGLDLFELTSASVIENEISLVALPEETVRKRLAFASPNVTLLKGLSNKSLQLLKQQGKKFDCIWIDGGHSYETVKSDFFHSLDLLEDGGTIFLDAYTTDPILPDVKSFIDNEVKTNPLLKTTIHKRHFDCYRKHFYFTVSVRKNISFSFSVFILRLCGLRF